MTKIARVQFPPAPQRPSPAPLRLGTRAFEAGTHFFDLSTRVLVMGILNRTPDSFFDGGAYFDPEIALRHAEQLVADGADIIDIGGVKAGPGDHVTPQEELERVLPTVEAVVANFDVPVSIDSFRAEVSAAAVAAGAVIVNDISGLADPAMIDLAARNGTAIVICHIQGRPRIPNPTPRYNDLHAEMREYMHERLERCRQAGISASRIVLDHALDFGKTEAQSLELLAHTSDLAEFGLPVLVSASNKRYLGVLLGTDVNDRNEASLASAAFAIQRGARIVRVHDVLGTRRVADTISALLEAELELRE